MLHQVRIVIHDFHLIVKVSDVKAKVRQEKGDAFPAEHQVLIFQGKVS